MAYSNKDHEIPCPPPSGFHEATPKTPVDGVRVNDCYADAQPKGHLEGAYEDFIDSVWGVPVGRRRG